MLNNSFVDEVRTKPAEITVPSEIVVTPNAAVEIKRLVEKRRAEGKKTLGLRIGIRGGGCTGFSYLFEWTDEPEKSTDRVFFAGEGISLVVDPKSFLYLKGMELDFVTSMMGYGFKFNNPNAKGACGCGESVQF